MKLSATRRFSREDLPQAPDWFDQYLAAQNQFNEQVHSAFDGAITVDNMARAIVTVDMTHNTEAVIKNPLPKGMRAVGAKVINSDGLPVDGSVILRNVNSNASTQKLGITALFQPPCGEATVSRTADQAIPNSTGTNFIWDTVVYSKTVDLSLASGVFTFRKAGVVSADAEIFFAGNAAGFREVWFAVSDSTYGNNRWADSAAGPDASISNQKLFNITRSFPVSAGATLSLQVYQTSGVSLNISQGGLTMRNSWSVRYVAPPATYSAKVTLEIIGG